jgi:hypothetical protein
MKATDVLGLLDASNGVESSAILTAEEKRGIQRELLRVLPTVSMYPQSEATLTATLRVVTERATEPTKEVKHVTTDSPSKAEAKGKVAVRGTRKDA